MRAWVVVFLFIPVTRTRDPIDAFRQTRHTRRAKARRQLEVSRQEDPRKRDTSTRIRQPLPPFELVYGQAAEYALGRALEDVVQVRGRPLDTWPYDVHPDLTGFDWMSYERSRRVLSGTPPVLQPSPVPADTLSYIQVVVSVGTDGEYTLRTSLAISIRATNATGPIPPLPTQTLPSANTLAPSSTPLSPLHGSVFTAMIAACVLLSVIILGGLGWLIAVRQHIRNRERSSCHSEPPTEIQDRSPTPTPRWPRTTAHSLSFVLPASPETSTRRRVRTAEQRSPTTPNYPSSPAPSSLATGPRKRAASLLQTIHTRAIRGSPRIGSSKTGREEVLIRKAVSPTVVPEELPVVEQSRRGEFTNSWCSAMKLDPFRSTGSCPTETPLSLARESESPLGERPNSPTPMRAFGGRGHCPMTLSEFGSPIITRPFGEAGPSMPPLAPSGPKEDSTTTTRANRIQDATVDSASTLARRDTYTERTNQIGMAILGTKKQPSPATQMGLTFDSFFSPKSIAEEAGFEEDTRFGDVASERMVRVAPSQETMNTAYATAPESGVSPRTRTSSVAHERTSQIGVVESPFARTEELGGSSGPGPDADKTGQTEMPDQVEYARGDQSLQVLGSFPGMLRGSLSYFPEDVMLSTPMIAQTNSRTGLSYRDPNDILLVPEDLGPGCIRLTRVESVERELQSRLGVRISGVEQGESPSQQHILRAEDSIISHEPDGKTQVTGNSVPGQAGESNSEDSLKSRKIDRSSSGLRYASQLFGSPKVA